MNEWLKTGEDPVTYLYAGRYLLEEEPGCLLANQVLEDIEAGKRVIVDLEAGTHHIHHHFYYGFLNRCINAGKSDLFVPGSHLTVIQPAGMILVWDRILEMYRKKGYIPDPMGLNEMSPEEYMKQLNRFD